MVWVCQPEQSSLEYDDIVIGSGLSAIATVLGLPVTRRVLVLCGPVEVAMQYYDSTRRTPCSNIGFGGLGNFWHGVIPMGGRMNIAGSGTVDFERLFQFFYPKVDLASRLGRPLLFIPWRPIRPRHVWRQLLMQRGDRLRLAQQSATRIAFESNRTEVWTDSAQFRAGRTWVCAGALQTPGLLDQSLDRKVSRKTVSDHVLCYIGLIDRAAHPDVVPKRVERTRTGLWIEACYNDASDGLFTLRPARFAYKRLDFGIEQRAVFGLPTGNAIAKILRAASAGLIAEALYNRAGLFSDSRFQSVYAQLAVPDAHWLHTGDAPVTMRTDIIRTAINLVRASPAWPQVLPSRRPELFLPVIHLHNSVDRERLRDSGVNEPTCPVQVADASVCENIGPEHHSFKMMAAAFARARTV